MIIRVHDNEPNNCKRGKLNNFRMKQDFRMPKASRKPGRSHLTASLERSRKLFLKFVQPSIKVHYRRLESIRKTIGYIFRILFSEIISSAPAINSRILYYTTQYKSLRMLKHPLITTAKYAFLNMLCESSKIYLDSIFH